MAVNKNLRLCRLCKWPNYTGLGFSLAESLESPQTIAIVESNSPAAAGGLKIDDVILDINKKDMSKASKDDVSKAIRTAAASGDRLELLVMEKRYYDKLKDQNVSFDRKKAKKIETPDTMPPDFSNFPENTPRTCQLNLSDPSEKFGFELIHGPNDTGAYIQEVNPNTPASNTPLRKSDRIIEIDDEFVDDQPYKNILNLIREGQSNSALKLYVVDTKTYKHYQKNNIPLQSTRNQRSSSANQPSAPPYTNEPKVDFEPIDDDEKPPPSVLDKLARPDKRSSKIKKSSKTQKLNTDDIRLCTINRADEKDTYGFAIEYDAEENYHSLKLTSGRDNNTSNAELAGIKNKDRLIEINDKNVEKMSTDDVKKRLKDKKYPRTLRLLVANAATYDYYKKQNKTINSQLPSVQKLPLDRNDRPPSPIDSTGEEPSPRRSSNTIPQPGDKKTHGVSALGDNNPLVPRVPKPDSPEDRRIYKLHRGSSAGYGLKLNSSTRDGLTHQITEIAPNSPAAKQGMRVGDYILTINNREVQNMDREEFNQCLRTSAESAESRGVPLVLEVTSEGLYARPKIPVKNSRRSSSTSDVTPLPSPSIPDVPYHQTPSPPHVTPPPQQKTPDIITTPPRVTKPNRPSFKPVEPLPRKCVLIHDLSFPGCGFGLIEKPPYDTPIVVELNPNSPAKRSGLAEGDHIIYIESQNIQNLGSFDSMTRLIQRTFQENGQVTLTTLTDEGYQVLKRRGGFLETDPFDYQSSNINQMKPRLYKLTLGIGEHDFGFSLQLEDVLSIKSVKKSLPADECGIRKGDIVLELNGQDRKNLSSDQKIKEIIEQSERARKLDILVIDIDGYRFSMKHAVPLNSLLSFVQTNTRNITPFKRVLL